MGGAQQPEIVRLSAAAAGIRHDVIDLQQVLRAATAPAGAVHVAAAAPVAPRHLALDRRRDCAAGHALLRCRSRPVEAPRLRRRSGVALRLRCRSVRVVSGFVSRLRRRLSRYLRRRRSGAVRAGLLLRRRSCLRLRRRSLLGAFGRRGAPPARRPSVIEPSCRRSRTPSTSAQSRIALMPRMSPASKGCDLPGTERPASAPARAALRASRRASTSSRTSSGQRQR